MKPSRLVVVSLSPAFERYLWVDELHPGRIHRPGRVVVTPGGKGIHVALAADRLSRGEVRTVGILGGYSGSHVRQLADEAGLVADWVDGSTETRTCTCVIDTRAHAMSEFYEAPTPVSASEWRHVVARVLEVVRHDGPTAVALSGSAPSGVDPPDLAALIEQLRMLGVPVFVDTSMEALSACLDASPAWVKVNQAEAEEVLGVRGSGRDPVAHGADLALALHGRGAQNAVVTLGSLGSVAMVRGEPVMHVAGTEVPRGMAVGSGDCYLAALAVALLEGFPARDALRWAGSAAATNAAGALVADFSREDIAAGIAAIRTRTVGVAAG